MSFYSSFILLLVAKSCLIGAPISSYLWALLSWRAWLFLKTEPLSVWTPLAHGKASYFSLIPRTSLQIIKLRTPSGARSFLSPMYPCKGQQPKNTKPIILITHRFATTNNNSNNSRKSCRASFNENSIYIIN